MYNYLLKNVADKNQTALYFLGSKLSYGQLLDKIQSAAAYLVKLGVKRKDSVTICLPNCPEAVIVFYAVNKLGCTANMVHPYVPTNQLVSFMKQTDSKLLIAMDFTLHRHDCSKFADDTTIICCRLQTFMPKAKGLVYKLTSSKKTQFNTNLQVVEFSSLMGGGSADTANREGVPAAYLHSGGTAGDPKTIVLSDYAFNSLAGYGYEMIRLEPMKNKGMMCALPLFHGFGLGVCVHLALSYGMVCILMPKFSPKQFVSTLNKQPISAVCGVPSMYAALLKQKGFKGKKLQKIERVFCGADTMDAKLKNSFDGLMKKYGSQAEILEGFGLTETVTVCCVNTIVDKRDGSVGRPMQNITIEAFDGTNKLERGQKGELCVASETRMDGYLNDSLATKQAMFTDTDGKIYVRTGDYGYVDIDGFVYFIQRIKRIIKNMGVAVFPSEIEKIISGLPFVKQACVIGVNDEKAGSVPKAFVVLKDESFDREQAKQQIIDACKQNLIKYAVPQIIEFKDSFPMTLIGKVNYKELS